MTRNYVHTARDYIKSHPLDLEQLNARFLARPDDRDALPPSSPTSTETLNSEDEHLLDLELERRSYHDLANDGGRPWYDISLLKDVVRRPGEYHAMLWVWQTYDDDWRKQLQRWKEFRARQPSTRGEDKFTAYIKALKSRLARHGFTQKYQLNKDPDRQDKRTAWIEYLSYEYEVYEQYTKFIKCRQQHYNNAWKVLVDSKLLRPFETQEFLDDISSPLQYKKEEMEAKEAMESAISAAAAAQQATSDPPLSDVSQSEREPQKMLAAAAQSELAAARKTFALAIRRKKLILEFWGQLKNYRSAKDEVKRYNTILPWMLQQVSLIESELGLHSSKVVGNDSNCGDGRSKGLKRGRVEETRDKRTCHHDIVNYELPSKRLRSNNSTHRTSCSDVLGGRRGTETSELINSQPKYLRRSSRIETRQKLSRPVILASSDAVKNAAGLTQVPTPPSAESQGRRPRRPEMTRSKKGRLHRSDRQDTSKPQGISKKGRPSSRSSSKTEQRSYRARNFSR